MSNSDEDKISELDTLIGKIGNLEITDNFVNLKPDNISEVIPEINPQVTEIGQTSSSQSFNRPIKGYAGLSTTAHIIDKYTPFEKTRGEPINPFGIYLDVDCIRDPEEAIDKWETALRIAATINKMDKLTLQHFIERSMVNSVLRYWQNISNDVKDSIYEDNNIANIITKVIEVIKLEFAEKVTSLETLKM